MATLHQLVKERRKTKKKKNRKISLDGCPQKRGTIIKTKSVTPRKPNSALRKVMKVRLTSNRHLIYAYIPGEKHRLTSHQHVFIRGGRVKDVPGMKYKGMRGRLDFFGVINRKTARSKYGVMRTLEDKRKSKKEYYKKILW